MNLLQCWYMNEKQRQIHPNKQLFMDSTSLNISMSEKVIMKSALLNVNGSGRASTFRPLKQNFSLTGNNTITTSYSQALQWEHASCSV